MKKQQEKVSLDATMEALACLWPKKIPPPNSANLPLDVPKVTAQVTVTMMMSMDEMVNISRHFLDFILFNNDVLQLTSEMPTLSVTEQRKKSKYLCYKDISLF